MKKWCILGRGITAKSHKSSVASNKGYMYIKIPEQMEELSSR